MKYTDEQLSRILAECDEGRLVKGGFNLWKDMWGNRGCCINQAAYNEPGPTAAYNINHDPAYWFDFNFAHTPDQLLGSLERRGFA